MQAKRIVMVVLAGLFLAACNGEGGTGDVCAQACARVETCTPGAQCPISGACSGTNEQIAQCIIAAACADVPKCTSSITDGGPKDGGGDARVVDGKTADLKPDGPKKPARWESVTGTAPKLTGHTATLLKDGRVLIAGGYLKDPTETYLKAAYLYSPTTNSLQAAGQMSVARAYHTASILPSGKVLVVGGEDSSSDHATTELYDPTQSAGSAWTAGPALSSARASHAAVVLKNGDVVVAGGVSGASMLASLAVYQASAGTWKYVAAAFTESRGGMGATLLSSGKVLFAGGFAGWGTRDTIEIYDPQAGTIVMVTDKLSYSRSYPTATLLGNGQVLIVGGSCPGCAGSDEIYDPSVNKITKVSHPGGVPNAHDAAPLKDGRALVVGCKERPTEALTYDPSGGGGWVTQPSLKVGRYAHTATALSDGSVLVVGGKLGTGTGYADTAERFYP